jgi:bacterioferritin
MERDELIEMLNEDLKDEHASIIRYLIHAYQVGEDTPFGSMLLSTAREEMWHMNWLGDEIGEMDAEPEMEQGVYPHDPVSNASLLRSYIEWEDNLVKVYADQAEQVESRELKRILQQLGLESITHRRRFQMWLDRLGPEGEEPFEFEEGSFTPDMFDRFKNEVDDQYKLVLQHLRHAFVFEEKDCPTGSELELTAMRHMKHLSHFAEELGEAGKELAFDYPGVDLSDVIAAALNSDIELTDAARERFIALSQDPELAEHTSLRIELDNMVTRNGLLLTVLDELLEAAAQVAEAKVEVPDDVEVPVEDTPDDDASEDVGPAFTVGSLKGSD